MFDKKSYKKGFHFDDVRNIKKSSTTCKKTTIFIHLSMVIEIRGGVHTKKGKRRERQTFFILDPCLKLR